MPRTALLLPLLFSLTHLHAAEVVLPGAHAHNDYYHARPLLDALDQGFCSVEADVFLVDGQLLVGHSQSELQPERTFERLYLVPLLERVRRNDGSVHGTGERFTLLVDIKSDASPTLAALAKALAGYAEMFCSEHEGQYTARAVQVVVSGNRSLAEIAACEPRYFGVDGIPGDLGRSHPTELMPLVSVSWTSLFGWRGSGEFPAAERAQLHQLVARVHREGKRLRFWATTDLPEVWTELQDAGVDVIGTDNLPALAAFLRNVKPEDSSR
jgi:hypothetical protein